jgi:hypothetical protein
MRKVILLILGLLTLTSIILADDYVNGYSRSNGTYVSGYYRSDSDGISSNNYSYHGNTNPYTGKKGYSLD